MSDRSCPAVPRHLMTRGATAAHGKTSESSAAIVAVVTTTTTTTAMWTPGPRRRRPPRPGGATASTITTPSSMGITTTVPPTTSSRPRSSRHLASSVPTKAIAVTALAPDGMRGRHGVGGFADGAPAGTNCAQCRALSCPERSRVSPRSIAPAAERRGSTGWSGSRGSVRASLNPGRRANGDDDAREPAARRRRSGSPGRV